MQNGARLIGAGSPTGLLRPAMILAPGAAAAASLNTQSAHFDGVDDKVTAAKTGLGASGSSYSIHAFFRLDTLPAAGQAYNFVAEQQATLNTKYPFTLRVNGDGNVRFELYDGTTWTAALDASGLTTNTWYEVLGIRQHSNTTLYIYINRVQTASQTYTNADYSNASATLLVGLDSSGSGEAWRLDGLLKDVRVFNVALNATNIAFLTVANIGKKPSEISGWDVANAANANQLRHYNFESPWSNATVNDASQVKDTGNDLSHATGVNLAGTATSGVDTVVPS